MPTLCPWTAIGRGTSQSTSGSTTPRSGGQRDWWGPHLRKRPSARVPSHPWTANASSVGQLATQEGLRQACSTFFLSGPRPEFAESSLPATAPRPRRWSARKYGRGSVGAWRRGSLEEHEGSLPPADRLVTYGQGEARPGGPVCPGRPRPSAQQRTLGLAIRDGSPSSSARKPAASGIASIKYR